MITGFKESKIFVKHISSDCRRTCDTGKCNPNKKWSKNKCPCECKKPLK